jgi:transcriptional regulator with XRE-family HTH domain
LSARLKELRKQAGMKQKDVAEAMARPGSGTRLVQRLEHGGAGKASLSSVVEYLRAVRAGFIRLKDLLDAYTSVPVSAPVRRAAKAAPKPRPSPDTLALTGRASAELKALALLERKRHEAEVERIRRRAGYWNLRKVYEHFLHYTLNDIGAPPWVWLRRRMASYGRKVFITLLRTRGPKERFRAERLERARLWADKQSVPDIAVEYMETVTALLFEDMQKQDELDWLPPEPEARELMARPRRRRVVTDAQMCLAEWWKAYNRYVKAWMALDQQVRSAATAVVEKAIADAGVARLYGSAVNWAAKVGNDTEAGTTRREQNVAQFLAWPWSERLDRALLGQVLEAALRVWDAQRKSLPPGPGPRPR